MIPTHATAPISRIDFVLQAEAPRLVRRADAWESNRATHIAERDGYRQWWRIDGDDMECLGHVAYSHPTGRR